MTLDEFPTLIKLGMTDDTSPREGDVDLLRKDDASPHKDDVDFLQKDARTRLRDIILEHIDYVAKPPEEGSRNTISYPRPHRAILIEGGRGSGKTTFLIKALTQLQKAEGVYKDIGEEVWVLQIVDPTLIESKDHIVLLILQLIDDAVDEPSCRSKDTDALDKARNELAEGLGLIDGIGKSAAFGDEWEDARWVMSRGLEKAGKARWFERKLNIYINCALKVLKRKAFVLAFDDVDTNFENGHKILETLRKYLTSPQLVMLLSGEIDLYRRLVRRAIYDTFGNKVLKQESDLPNFRKAVLELEEQYLLKLLPPRHRIPMRPLGALMSERIGIETTGSSSSRYEILSWAEGRIRKLLREGDGRRESPFLPVLFREHLRLVLTYLRALDDKSPQSSRERVFQAFGTRLIEAKIPIDLMQVRNLEHTLKTCFDWMVNRDQPADLLRFGAMADLDETIGLHCLALALAEVVDRPAAAMRGLLTLALPLALTQQPDLSDETKRKGVFAFLWGRNPSLAQAGPRLSTMSHGDASIGRLRSSAYGSIGLASRFNRTSLGFERVYGSEHQSQGLIADFVPPSGKAAERYAGALSWISKLNNAGQGKFQTKKNTAWFTIEDILDRNRAHSFTPVLRMLCFRRYTKDGQIMRAISALSLFAAMANILEGRETPSKVGKATAVDANLLHDLALDTVIPHFGLAGGEATLLEDDDAGAEDDDSSQEPFSAGDVEGDEKGYADFLNSLGEWADFVHALGEHATLSPRMLGAVALRIDDDLRGFDTAKGSDLPVSTGQLLHRQITTILNAIITVMQDDRRRRESPKSSDAPLGRSLRGAPKEKPEKPLPPFAVALLSCPLLWAFLNPDETITLNQGPEVKLRDVSLKALKTWRDDWNRRNEGNEIEADFETWSTAPKITVGLKSPSVKEPQSMKIDGFHDLLNVVPRYAGASPRKSRQ
jgi:hypothetical protein